MYHTCLGLLSCFFICKPVFQEYDTGDDDLNQPTRNKTRNSPDDGTALGKRNSLTKDRTAKLPSADLAAHRPEKTRWYIATLSLLPKQRRRETDVEKLLLQTFLSPFSLHSTCIESPSASVYPSFDVKNSLLGVKNLGISDAVLKSKPLVVCFTRLR